MNRILTIAGTEFRIARRNRWVTVSALMMMIFALVLTAAGSAPSGALAADRLSVVVASLTSLAVYVVPLIALLLSFDAVAGEVERGTLPLLLTYPVSRAEALAGKLLAHLGVLALALLAGYGLAAVVAIIGDRSALAGLPALWRLGWSSILLGITFLGAGYALSSLAGRPSGAAETVPFSDPKAAQAFAAQFGGRVVALSDIPDAEILQATDKPATVPAGPDDYTARLRALSQPAESQP